MWISILINVIKVVVLFAVLMTMVAYATWFERRVVAFIQSRLGPNRVGPFGLLQPIADAIKLLFKETFVPSEVNSKFLFSTFKTTNILFNLIESFCAITHYYFSLL